VLVAVCTVRVIDLIFIALYVRAVGKLHIVSYGSDVYTTTSKKQGLLMAKFVMLKGMKRNMELIHNMIFQQRYRN
jgi:hypothetical protein